MNPRIWESPSVQSIYMPIGDHVARGFKKLARSGVEGIDASLLEEKQAGLADGGFTTLLIAHSFQSDLAKRCGGLVPHINTGLHVLGDGSACAI